MKGLKKVATQLWNDESGQGTAEYVLLIAIVVGLIIMFKDRIKGMIDGKLGQIEGGFGDINVQ